MNYWERTEVEYKATEPNDPWQAPVCVHCGQTIGYHWQTAEGKIFCAREMTSNNTEGDQP